MSPNDDQITIGSDWNMRLHWAVKGMTYIERKGRGRVTKEREEGCVREKTRL